MTLQSEHFVLPLSTQEALGFDALWRELEENCGCIYGRENLNEAPFLGSGLPNLVWMYWLAFCGE